MSKLTRLASQPLFVGGMRPDNISSIERFIMGLSKQKRVPICAVMYLPINVNISMTSSWQAVGY